MAQYDPIAVKTGVPSALGADTLRADRTAVAGLTTAAPASGDAVQVSAALTVQKALNTSATPVVGVYDGVSGSVVRAGVVAVNLGSGVVLADGDPVYLSATAGAVTNVKPTKDVLHEVGTVVDAAGRKILLQPRPPITLPPSPPASLWVAGFADATHQYLSPAWTDQGSVGTTDANGMGVLWDGNYVWTASNDNPTKIRKYDPVTRALVAGPFTPGGYFGGLPGCQGCLAFDGVNYWIATTGASVVKMSPAGGLITTIAGFGDVMHIAYDGAGSLLIPNRYARVVRKLDVASGLITGTATLSPGGIECNGVCYGGYYYQPYLRSPAPWNGYLAKIRISDMAIMWDNSMGFNYPQNCATHDGTHIYVASTAGRVYKNQLSDGANVTSIALTNMPNWMILDRGYLWATQPVGGFVKQIDPATMAQVNVISHTTTVGIASTSYLMPWT